MGILGRDDTGNSTGNNSTRIVRMSRFTLAEDGMTGAVKIYSAITNAATKYRCAIYQANATPVPTTQMGVTNEATGITAATWMTLSFPTAVVLPAADYFLMVQVETNPGAGCWGIQLATGTNRYYAAATYPYFPNPWSGTLGTDLYDEMCIYSEYSIGVPASNFYM